MNRLSCRLLVPIVAGLIASCGAEPKHRDVSEQKLEKSPVSESTQNVQTLKENAPKFMIARVATNDLHSKAAKIEFVSVTNPNAIQSGADAEKAFGSGEPISQGSNGAMSLASDSGISFNLGMPQQNGPGQTPPPIVEPMPGPGPGQGPGQGPGPGYGPGYGPGPGNCGCGFFNGVLSFFGNMISGTIYYVSSVLRTLNPLAILGNYGYGYQYSNQYTNGGYNYSVYNQVPGMVNNPGQGPQGKPYPNQGQPQPQGQPYPNQGQPTPNQPLPAQPVGQEPMPTTIR